jgi:hypothetical protein
MYISEDKIIEIFYLADNFCKEFDQAIAHYTLGNPAKKKPRMSNSEVITIMVIFHLGEFRNMKHFYMFHVQKHMTSEFPKTVSYNRFVELMQQVILPMTCLLKMCCMGKSTGISFVDSTKIAVCKNKRIKRNKVFKGIATVGKSTMGWFYGFKLHLIINDKGEILNFVITQANVDDREPLYNPKFLENIKGKLYADKGYVSQKLTEILFIDGIHLITYIRNNMKNTLLELRDKILLRKRSIIETINDELKNMCQIEHSRHRSFTNFIANTLSALMAYSFFPKKPSLKFDTVTNDSQLCLFY